MQIGYARVSTSDQNLDLQKDALQLAGCQKIFTDTASGVKAQRPGLTEALQHCRSGDTLVVWKLDRLGRSLSHLVETVRELVERGIGFKSLQESIDTTTSGGKLIFHLFASLAEFERDIIRERTNAGLSAARARGRKGGRPKGVDEKKRKAVISLSKDRERSVKEICEIVGISRNTYYKYINYENKVVFSQQSTEILQSQLQSEDIQPLLVETSPQPKIMKVNLWLQVENNNKFVRGKSKAREEIERYVLSHYSMEKPNKNDWEYILSIPYTTEEELENIIYRDIFAEAESHADMRNCFIEVDMNQLDDPERRW
jgi:DNA invertase Pin-like site-specific DNA recombinase